MLIIYHLTIYANTRASPHQEVCFFCFDDDKMRNSSFRGACACAVDQIVFQLSWLMLPESRASFSQLVDFQLPDSKTMSARVGWACPFHDTDIAYIRGHNSRLDRLFKKSYMIRI